MQIRVHHARSQHGRTAMATAELMSALASAEAVVNVQALEGTAVDLVSLLAHHDIHFVHLPQDLDAGPFKETFDVDVTHIPQFDRNGAGENILHTIARGVMPQSFATRVLLAVVSPTCSESYLEGLIEQVEPFTDDPEGTAESLRTIFQHVENIRHTLRREPG